MNEAMNYQNRKEEIRRKLRETAENFVYIGYQLKRVRESREYEQDGYGDILEFAQKEYGLQKDDTYRFIRINDKYSIGGDSPELAEPFKGMAQTKLSEMLSLPDKDLNLITPETTREDIRELKRFNSQEPEKVPEKEGSDIQAIILEFFRPAAGRPASSLHDLLLDVIAITEGSLTDSVLTQEELIQEKLNPKGNGTFRAGRYMLFLYDASNGLKYKAFGESENHPISYLSFAKTTHLIFTSRTQESGLDPWENVYGKEPETEKIEEPSQDSKPQMPEIKAGVDKKEQTPKEEKIPESYPQEKPESSLKAPAQLQEDSGQEDDDIPDTEREENPIVETPSEVAPSEEAPEQQEKEDVQDIVNPQEPEEDTQMEIENYPEYLPEGYIKCEDGIEVHETATYQKWKDIQNFIKDLHSQIVDRLEPDIETSQKLRSGVNYLKSIMDDFVEMKEV